VTPLMETVRNLAPDHNSGQLGPRDIRRTGSWRIARLQSQSQASLLLPALWATCHRSRTRSRSGKIRHAMVELPLQSPQTQQNSLKEPSLVFAECGAKPGVDCTEDQYRRGWYSSLGTDTGYAHSGEA
jgi:hypothetical protein